MANLFDIGRSGLNSYRQSLAITGQNIANINTDGYKRRGAELEELSSAKASVLEKARAAEWACALAPSGVLLTNFC